MLPRATYLSLAGLLGLAGWMSTLGLYAQEKPLRPALGAGLSTPPPPSTDGPKYTIEMPTKKLLQDSSAEINPKASPGKVHWHPTLAAAQAAAARSGKPVLLFHMMGRLDDRFC